MKLNRKKIVIGLSIAFLLCCLPPLIPILFMVCCGVMRLLGYILGLTYREVCVIGNIYLQGAIWAASSLLPLIVAIVAVVKKREIGRVITLFVSMLYSAVYWIILILLCRRYAPPLAPAFDRCVDDLFFTADLLGTTYEVVNIIFFVAFFGLSIIANYVFYHIIKRAYLTKHEKVGALEKNEQKS